LERPPILKLGGMEGVFQTGGLEGSTDFYLGSLEELSIFKLESLEELPIFKLGDL